LYGETAGHRFVAAFCVQSQVGKMGPLKKLIQERITCIKIIQQADKKDKNTPIKFTLQLATSNHMLSKEMDLDF